MPPPSDARTAQGAEGNSADKPTETTATTTTTTTTTTTATSAASTASAATTALRFDQASTLEDFAAALRALLVVRFRDLRCWCCYYDVLLIFFTVFLHVTGAPERALLRLPSCDLLFLLLSVLSLLTISSTSHVTGAPGRALFHLLVSICFCCFCCALLLLML
jgi:hypothetical protein